MSEQEVLQLNNISKKISEIYNLLCGNQLNKDDKGMVGDVNDHEVRLLRVEKMIAAGKWLLIGMGISSGVGIASIISWILDHVK
jgi:hypothetical protein